MIHSFSAMDRESMHDLLLCAFFVRITSTVVIVLVLASFFGEAQQKEYIMYQSDGDNLLFIYYLFGVLYNTVDGVGDDGKDGRLFFCENQCTVFTIAMLVSDGTWRGVACLLDPFREQCR